MTTLLGMIVLAETWGKITKIEAMMLMNNPVKKTLRAICSSLFLVDSRKFMSTVLPRGITGLSGCRQQTTGYHQQIVNNYFGGFWMKTYEVFPQGSVQ